jgi:hypothetical protein
MDNKIEMLIQRAAEARRALQEACRVEEAARNARKSADRRHEMAMIDLNEEMRGRVNALAPWEDGGLAC